MAKLFVELAHLYGVAGIDTELVAKSTRVRFTVAIHPEKNVTRWVTCFGPRFPEALAVKKGDRLEIRGYWSGENEVNVIDVIVAQSKAEIEKARADAKAKRAEGTAPAADWKEDEQLHMQEQAPANEELPL